MIDRKLIEEAIDSALDKVLGNNDEELNQEAASTVEDIDLVRDKVDNDRAKEVESNKVNKDHDNFETKVNTDVPVVEEPIQEVPTEVPAEVPAITEVASNDVKEEFIENTSEETNEKVDEIVEEAVEETPSYDFLGVNVKINKAEDGYNVEICKDDVRTVEHLDSIELPMILNAIEVFFNSLVLAEDDISTEEISVEEDVEAFDDNNKPVTLASLRKIYSHRIEKFLEHGLVAKELALDTIKNKINAKTIGDITKQISEKNTILSAKKEIFNVHAIKYANEIKKNKQYKEATSLISSAINTIHDSLSAGNISKEVANKALEKYKGILSNVVKSDNLKTLIANVASINKVNTIIAKHVKENAEKNTIVANKVNNTNKTKINTVVSKKQPIINKRIGATKNILNSGGWNDNSTLLSNTRHDGIAEMSTEIMRIAGLLDEE